MTWWISEFSRRGIVYKLRKRVIPNLHHLRASEIRTCAACQRLTVIVSLGPNDEFRLCLRCRANLRYEMLAEHIRSCLPDLSTVDVLELDFSSPLRALLAQAHAYTRSYYRAGIAPGTPRDDGAICQDITRLTFPDESLDLIVSSDVLEHVPDAHAAFRETARVLKPGGMHVFTVPPRSATKPRALLKDGAIDFVMPAEYHYDPLDPAGVLSFWDYGPDIAEVLPVPALDFRIASGPKGPSNRIVWEARKRRTQGMADAHRVSPAA
jgi:SAM-dependent methyltransferase